MGGFSAQGSSESLRLKNPGKEGPFVRSGKSQQKTVVPGVATE